MGNEDIKPDTITYNTAITAWSNSRHKKWNASRGDLSANGRAIPHGVTRTQSPIRQSTALLTLHGRSNSQDSNAGMRAEALLKRMDEQYKMGNKGAKPNTLTRSSAINVWAKKQRLKRCNASRSHSSANGRIILKLGNAYVELNTVSCSSVIPAWANASQHLNAGMRGEGGGEYRGKAELHSVHCRNRCLGQRTRPTSRCSISSSLAFATDAKAISLWGA